MTKEEAKKAFNAGRNFQGDFERDGKGLHPDFQGWWEKQLSQPSDEESIKRLYDWLMDENREPAQTKFTAGEMRNLAKEIEFRIGSATEEGCTCQECGNKYKVDIMIPDNLWLKISPSKSEGGLLCGPCIIRKIEGIGEFDYLYLKTRSVTDEEIEREGCDLEESATYVHETG